MSERPFPPPSDLHEEDYAAPEHLSLARATITQPVKPSSGALWLILSLGLFLVAGAGKDSAVQLGVLAGVILVHEGGHAIAMRIFGYRDLRIFFIPFFGGAASGKKTGAPVWQQAIVLFAGPVPGILLGFALVLGTFGTKDALVGSIASSLLFINGFNLAPFVPLDGGRALALAVSGRHRYLENAFVVFGAVALAILALWLEQIILGIFAFLSLTGIPRNIRMRSVIDRIRARHGVLPSDPNAVSVAALGALFNGSAAMTPEPYGPARATSLRTLWERLAVPPPSFAISALIIAGWFASVGLTLTAFIAYAFSFAGGGK